MYVMNETIIGGISVDKAYPVGSLYFSEGVNPNEAFPKTAWIRAAQGRVLVGVDEGDAEYSGARKTGGAKSVTLAAGHLPAHGHPFTGNAVNSNAAAHTHNLLGGVNIYQLSGSGAYLLSTAGSPISGLITSDGAHTHTTSAAANGTVGNAGSGGAHNNLQPYSVCEIWERIA